MTAVWVGSLTVPNSDRLFDPSAADEPARVGNNSASVDGESAGEQVVAYTDGACSGNPGPGGWAWVVPDGPYAAGCAVETTNQRMELTATLEAVRAFAGPLLVVSDSTYVVHCFRDGWWEKWLRKGWVNAKKEPVANRDLWEPLIEAVQARGNVEFRWVKGHSGDRWNDEADRLAVEAGTRQVGLKG
ncbi:MAG: ribonuclease HI [Actinomycetia bacterium]|jgi:ribonuclease HI|nr:ribonuclease HI [Actinomycetes bacterium]